VCRTRSAVERLGLALYDQQVKNKIHGSGKFQVALSVAGFEFLQVCVRQKLRPQVLHDQWLSIRVLRLLRKMQWCSCGRSLNRASRSCLPIPRSSCQSLYRHPQTACLHPSVEGSLRILGWRMYSPSGTPRGGYQMVGCSLDKSCKGSDSISCLRQHQSIARSSDAMNSVNVTSGHTSLGLHKAGMQARKQWR
jgi:hypothetical protein